MRGSTSFAVAFVALLIAGAAKAEEAQEQCAALWSQAEAAAAAGRFPEAADLYFQLYADHHDECEQFGGHDQCEVLYNLAVTTESDRRIGQAIQIRTRLFNECGDETEYARAHGGKASSWAKRAIYQIGRNYESFASLLKAARYYEEFAMRYPGEEEAPAALEKAITYRVAADMGDEAIADAALFEKHYARRREHKARAARVALSIGVIYERRAEAVTRDTKAWIGSETRRAAWQAAEGHYASLLARYDRAASPDVVIRANTRLGRVRSALGEKTRHRAIAAFTKALAEADRGVVPNDSNGLRLQLEDPIKLRLERYAKLIVPEGDEDEEARARRLELMIEAIAEARFHVAERAFEGAIADLPPPFAPDLFSLPRAVSAWLSKTHPAEARALDEAFRTASEEDRRAAIGHAELRHWIETALEPWERRREALQALAERLYVAAMDENVPEWKVGAAARIGDLHLVRMKAASDLADEASCVDGRELSCGAVDALGLVVTRARDEAILFYRSCLEHSTRSRWSGTWSRLCEQQLNALDARLYPLNDEIRAEPTYLESLRGPAGLVRTIEAPH